MLNIIILEQGQFRKTLRCVGTVAQDLITSSTAISMKVHQPNVLMMGAKKNNAIKLLLSEGIKMFFLKRI